MVHPYVKNDWWLNKSDQRKKSAVITCRPNSPTLKCAIKKHFCFSFEFNDLWSFSYLFVLKIHQVSLNLNEKQKKFLMTHLTDVLSIMGRWIWPYSLHSLSMLNCNLLLYCQSKATQPLFRTSKVSNFINYKFFLQLNFLQKKQKNKKNSRFRWKT